VQALLADEVKVAGGKAYIVRGEVVATPPPAPPPRCPRMPRTWSTTTACARAARRRWPRCSCFRPTARRAREGHRRPEGQADEGKLPLIEKALAAETDAGLKAQLELLRAAVLITSPDKAKRLAAARLLAASGQPATRSLLIERWAARDRRRGQGRAAAHRWTPCSRAWPGASAWACCSPASAWARILLLVALGLAITYGLMGVINMAHGELMMIGAYATYVVQNLFRQYLPGVFDWYMLAAIPVSFLAARWWARCWSAA
jgi:urea transport system permease protein